MREQARKDPEGLGFNPGATQESRCIPSVSVGSPKKVLDLNKCTSSSGGSSMNSNVIVPISSKELTVIWHSSFSSLSNEHCH